MSKARDLANVATRSADLKAGTTAFFAMTTAPSGWLKANGANVSRTAYADLFAVIGTGYGAGDGSTTFALPDLRGEFLRCWDDSRNLDSGRGIGTLQASENLSHTHTILASPHTGGVQYSPGRVSVNRGYPLNIGGSYSHVVNAVSDGNMPTGIMENTSTGSSEARPRNVALLACIKF
jgi:microcystin-dependent protein